ncbi:MAG: hypothetical protein AB2697_21280 [Candidatus Thiodiazotropha endolucinida]
MSSAFAKELNKTIEQMPIVLKIVCGAALVLGMLQILALVFPSLSPKMLGKSITSPFLMLIVGSFHIAIGLGIYKKQKWSIPLIVLLPIFQFGALYVDRGFLSKQALISTFIFVLAWAVLFSVYFVHSKAGSYFEKSNNA